jgi:membrane-associated protease RseP (regulator of RpoE activity)
MTRRLGSLPGSEPRTRMILAIYLVAILGVAALVIVHEAGHYLAARRFGMRVLCFSIGFGPTVWKHEATGGPTVYRIGLVPFLAYVQIAGMNPYEESDPKDAGSYANAGLWARIATVAAGPLANYVLASIPLFFGLLVSGRAEALGLGGAAKASLAAPATFVVESVRAIAGWVAGHHALAVAGPVGLVKAAALSAKAGPGVLLQFLGMLSAAMAAFNLLPLPFLDGGRLVFLGIEAVSRRKMPPKLEVWVHAAGHLALMTFMVVVTYADLVAK